MTDEQIIALYFARDEQAIVETANAHGAYCFGVAMRILRSHLDSEECVNDTWLKAWNSIPPQNPPSLKVYLGRLVRHLSIDRLRTNTRRKRNREYEVALDELVNCALPEETDESDMAALTAALNEFLEGLNTVDRRLFVGRYWHFYPITALAETYGLTADNTSVRLHRMREKLKNHLTERGFTI
jgi:RNA polymerase sigma-70 factor (ECF subfamily)